MDTLRVLFFGDVVGRVGRDALARRLGPLKRELRAHLVIANGENAAGGAGITPAVAADLFRLGVDAITLGNHAWDRPEIASYIDSEPRLIRPLNFPPGTPGLGQTVLQGPGGVLVGLVNLMGRVFSPVHLADPFRAAEEAVAQLRRTASVVIVDFHAEATSEKQAMGFFLDGRAGAVLGTHTHVQTADECVLPGGTAYITDVGMTGPWPSVIGMDTRQALERFLTQMPVRLEPARSPAVVSAVLLEFDPARGLALAIRRILERQGAVETGEKSDR